ncbi:MAG: adenylate/guanylate cyclase domain-containing protein [Planctomycetota bacterium]
MKRFVLTALAAALLSLPAILEVATPLENAIYDLMQRHLPPTAVGRDRTEEGLPRSSDVAIVVIDDDSLHRLARYSEPFMWPWDRAVYASLVKYLESCGAKAVVLDMLLTTPLRGGELGDLALAEAIAAAKIPIVMGTVLGEGARYDENAAIPPAEPVTGEPDLYPLHLGNAARPYEPGTLPLDVFMEAGVRVGFANSLNDADMVIRRARPLAKVGDTFVPSLALRALLDVERDPQGLRIDGQGLHVGASTVPLTEEGDLLIRFLDGARDPIVGGYFPVYPAALVATASLVSEGIMEAPEGIDLDKVAEAFAGRIVLLGSNSPSLYDVKGTPLSDTYPGVLIQATIIDNILNGAVLRPLPKWLKVSLPPALAVAVVVVVLASRRRIWVGLAAGLGFVVAAAGLAILPFAKGLIALPIGKPLFAGLVSNVLASSVRSLTEGRLRRRLTGLFQHYVPAPVVRRLVENPKLVNIAGERRHVTVFFSDIKGFTSISNRKEFREHPEELTAYLNRYLTVMTEAILEFGGTIDKYIGDAVVAVFGAPLDQPNHPEAACRAALRCQEVLKEFNTKAAQEEMPPLFTRIGLSTGHATAGNVGSIHRYNYTVIGQAVNLGARYEAANKVFGTWILTGQETATAAQDTIVTREIDLARVPGIDADAEPLRLFEVVAVRAAIDPARARQIEVFGQALGLYRQRQFAQARELLSQLDSDPVAALYLRRCEEAAREPPPPGVIVHELKVK